MFRLTLVRLGPRSTTFAGSDEMVRRTGLRLPIRGNKVYPGYMHGHTCHVD